MDIDKKTGKTITTYLVDSNPQGIKQAFISNRICQCLAIPRSLLKEAKSRPELKFPSLYLLLGDENENLAYIGETENFLERIADHSQKKNFWVESVVFSAKDESLTKADVKYLEYLAIEQSKKANVYRLDENKTFPNEPNMPEHQRDTVAEFFQDVRMLSSFLNYRLFDEQKTHSQGRPTIFCKDTKGTDAQGIYEDKLLRVLKDSKVRKDVTDSYGQVYGRERSKMLSENATESDNFFVLKKDITFLSPSAASNFCLGCFSNGKKYWKDKNGKTLGEGAGFDC